MNYVAIEMDEFKFEALEYWRNTVLEQRSMCDDVSKKMMHLQNDSTASLSDFETVLKEMDEAHYNYKECLQSLGEFVLKNWFLFDIVKIGDADE